MSSRNETPYNGIKIPRPRPGVVRKTNPNCRECAQYTLIRCYGTGEAIRGGRCWAIPSKGRLENGLGESRNILGWCHRKGLLPRYSKFRLTMQSSAAFTLTLTWTFFRAASRSEEHTSELQSLRHLVCRLLLVK